MPAWYQKLPLLIRSLLLTLTQILLLLIYAPGGTDFGERYLRLNQWDSMHYIDIAENGYRLPPDNVVTSESIHSRQANVVFFPGLPLLARETAAVTGLSVPAALLGVAQLSCWIFWTLLLLLLERPGIPPFARKWVPLLVFIHPASFFLVCGYTEAPFLAGLLGYIFCSHRWVETSGRSRGVWLFAAFLSAAFMSSIRIVSFAAAPYPLLLLLCRSGRRPALKDMRNYIAPSVAGLGCTLGAVAFFWYCHLRFDDWATYFRLEEIGWGNHRRWFALIDPLSYVPRFFFEDTINSFARLSVTFTLILFLAALYLERLSHDWRRHFPLIFTAFFLFYIPLTGKAAANMDSMIRYTLTCYLLLMMTLLSRLPEVGARIAPSLRRWTPPARPAFWSAVLLLSFAIQVWMAYRFLRGDWIA